MKIEKITVTPYMAQSLLEKNTNNRLPTRSNIDFLINELKGGRFIFNGDAIRVDTSGVILDGQHRLIACVESGISFETLLVEGLSKDSMPTIDTGRNRKASDVFSIHNINNSTNIAASCRMIMEGVGLNRKTSKNGTVKLSNQEIYDFYVANSPLIDDMYRFVANTKNKNVSTIAPSFATALLYLLGLESRLSKSFIRELFTGIKETESNSAQKLRDKIINSRISGVKISTPATRDMCLYAWKRYKKGESIKSFQWKSSTPIGFLKVELTPKSNKLTSFDFNEEKKENK